MLEGFMGEDRNKRESFFHAALIYQRRIKAGQAGDQELRGLLGKHNSLEEIFQKEYPLLCHEDILGGMRGIKRLILRLEKLPFQFEALTVNDERFPEELKRCPEAAPVLYARGDLALIGAKNIAVVGTRELEDRVDIEEGRKILQRLLDKGYGVVSGLAKGCDTLAHRYMVEGGGRTIAILGTPLDKYYPKENKELQELIASEHLLISQYPIGVKTQPHCFAHRNKTLVTLAKEGVVVIRAGDKSGTQYAIRHCLEQGKLLYVLEHNLELGYQWTEKLKGKFKVPNGKGGA